MSLNPNCLQGYDFINRFVPLVEGMMNLGLTKQQALAAAATQKFVRDFADTPEWFVSAKGLPKGYKWSDGRKYSIKGGKRSAGEIYIFVSIDEDLYIKGFFRDATFYAEDDVGKFKWYKAPKEIRNQIIVIRKWKSLNANDVALKLHDGCSPFFRSSILDYWKENGVRVGFTEPIMKEIKK